MRYAEVFVRRGSLAAVISGLLVSLGSVCPAQWPTTISGVPFTAFVTQTATWPDKTTTSSGVIARRSDGSGYWGVSLVSSTDPKDPTDRKTAAFNDIPGHKNYTLLLWLHSYEVFPNDLAPHAYTPQTAAAYLKRQGGEGYERTVGIVHIKMLGIRNIEGFDTVGTLEVLDDGRRSERWYSPELDMALESKSHDPKTGDLTVKVEQIKTGEPDAALFQVPAGFTPVPRDRRRQHAEGSTASQNN